MDTVGLSVETNTYVSLANDNGTLNPTRFDQLKTKRQGYSDVGTDSASLDMVYFKTHVLAGSETMAIDFGGDTFENPIDPDQGVVGGTVSIVNIWMEQNEDGSAGSASIAIGAGDPPALLFFGSGDDLIYLQGYNDDARVGGEFLWRGIAGVPVGGDLLQIENLDPVNDATFVVLIGARSAA